MTRDQQRDVRIQAGIDRMRELGIPEAPLKPLEDWLNRQEKSHKDKDES